MIVARDDEAHRRAAAMIKAREVGRTYLALVEGQPRSRTGTIDAPLGRDYRARERRAVGGRGAARGAHPLHGRSRRCRADTLVEARLETGRTHQIRAHFAAIGHPVAGDPRYGHAGRHGLERQFLHSARLRLRHPFDGERARAPISRAAGARALAAALRAGPRAGSDASGASGALYNPRRPETDPPADGTGPCPARQHAGSPERPGGLTPIDHKGA